MSDFLKFANSFQVKSKLGLERISRLIELLGNPQSDMKFIHIAGTNGKGSVCSVISKTLSLAGYKTGKYISPNMIKVNERISVDGKDISDEDMARIISSVEDACNIIKNETGETPSQFEIWTATAFCYFKEQNCDYVILETGLGGRLDATNVIDSPVLSVITKIDLDHTEYLGNTIYKVAGEKAGIIKENCPVVTTHLQPEDALKALTEKCEITGSKLHTTKQWKETGREGLYEIFEYSDLQNLKSGLSGHYQIENVCIAIESLKLIGIGEKHIRQGVLEARNIGRFEVIRENPYLIYDGAHNLNGAKALADNLTRYFDENHKFTLVCAFMADKDVDGILDILENAGFKNRAEFMCTTVLNNERAMTSEVLCEKLKQRGFKAEHFKSIKEALESADKTGNDTIIFGSLYLYKDFKESAKEK